MAGAKAVAVVVAGMLFPAPSLAAQPQQKADWPLRDTVCAKIPDVPFGHITSYANVCLFAVAQWASADPTVARQAYELLPLLDDIRLAAFLRQNRASAETQIALANAFDELRAELRDAAPAGERR
ncbi:MAG TPA: hypothetical protein VED40_08250 [Azospirillaceae bacterium]|nr:hypothetical protein [Azospirillaceae bacterium]